MPELDIAGIVKVLNAHGVRYVVIGGVAALVHDLPVPATVDIDVTPGRDAANLGRLADAFDDLDACLLTAEEAGTWFPRRPVENWAVYDTLHLITRLGALDIVFSPDGAPHGYDDLAPSGPMPGRAHPGEPLPRASRRRDARRLGRLCRWPPPPAPVPG